MSVTKCEYNNILGTATCPTSQGCPSGYKLLTQIKDQWGNVVDICEKETGKPSDAPSDADFANCRANGMALLGPDYLRYWEAGDDAHPNTGLYKSAVDVVTYQCNHPAGIDTPTKQQVWNTWQGFQEVLSSQDYAAVKKDADRLNCFDNQIRAQFSEFDTADPTLTKFYLTACNKCPSAFSNPNACTGVIPPTPLGPPPIGPVIPVVPPQDLCPPGHEDCMADIIPIPPIRPLDPPDYIPIPPTPIVPFIPIPDNNTIPWWKLEWQNVLADLSELFLSPEYIGGVAVGALAVQAVTKSLPKSLIFTGAALLAPYTIWRYKRFMMWVRAEIAALKRTYEEFKQFEYPVLFIVASAPVLGAIVAVENYFGAPSIIMGETFMYGTVIMLIGAAVTWFLNTSFGKGITNAGSDIIKFLDGISSP